MSDVLRLRAWTSKTSLPSSRAEHERIVQWAYEQGQRTLESLPSTPEQLEAFLQRIEEKEAASSTRRGRGQDA